MMLTKLIQYSAFFIATALLFLTGCATLDQSECQSANWQIIGLEDGASGKPTSTIGRHQSACSEYAITPNLNDYLIGHKKGLEQYCTFEQGFSLGLRGQQLNLVCNSVNMARFKQGYKKGFADYRLIQEVERLEKQLAKINDQLKQKHKEIKHKENRIVNEQSSQAERRELLKDVKLLSQEIQDLEINKIQVEKRLFIAEERYEQSRQQ